MMSTKKYFAILTDVGQSKIAQAVAGGQKLNVTTFLVGDGNGEYYVPTSDMTAIKNEVWRGTISKADVVQDAQKILRITTVIPAEVSGFIVREIALLDETGELVAIGNTPDLPKVRLEDGASTELKLTMRLAVKNTEALSFTIDPHTVIMTKDMLDTHNVDSNAHSELFEGKADKEHQHSTDDITSGTLPIARGGTGNTTGNAATATKLQTARTIRTNLASTSTASFDGTANVTPGVTGTLPIANGGTGNTTGNAATATKLQTARTIDGMPFDGSKNIVHFGVCNTAAATAAKTVALTGFTLTEGARVAVFFTNTNTANNLTLNVNSTGAKAISCIKGYYAPIGQWEANQIVEFVYYNNHWIMITANARRLYAARTIRTNLASTSTASFDGTANITPGVTGTLPITNGGTGATTASTALSNLGGFAKTGGTISGATTIQGNLTLKTASSNYGCKINFGDGDYVHISEPTDDNMEIKAKNVNFVVSGNITKNGGEFGSVTKAQIDTALSLNRDGTIAIGYQALNAISTSTNDIGNIAIGKNAMGVSNNCSHNICLGADAGYNIRGYTNSNAGYGNIAIGVSALRLSTTGSYNVSVGANALQYTDYSECVGLGHGAAVTGSNQMQLGNSSITVYAQKALVTRSDARDKLDIEDSPLGLNFIMKLRPVKYRINSREAYFEEDKERDFTATNDGSKAGKRPHYGMIAQEVKIAMDELGVDFAGYLDSKVDGGEDVLSLGYTEFIAPMIKAIQQQQHMIEQLQKEIELLKG